MGETLTTDKIKLRDTTAPINLPSVTAFSAGALLTGSAATDVEADARIPVVVDGTTYYIALYNG